MATNKTSGSKTPYEIRLELLQMAKEHLDTLFHAQNVFATQMVNAMQQANKATVEELKQFAPKAYSIDEITKKAAEMYAFVLKKD